MELNIRNMVCGRCIKTVKQVLVDVSLTPLTVDLGKVILEKPPLPKQLDELKTKLLAEGFELIDDQKAKIVQQVKTLILDLVHYKDLSDLKFTLSTYLSQQLHRDYSYLSNLFSSIENYTIEQFFILQKIEKVKELLVYNEMTLSEMAYKLGYSSTAHLSAQFKKTTGFTPSQFKQFKDHNRKELDQV